MFRVSGAGVKPAAVREDRGGGESGPLLTAPGANGKVRFRSSASHFTASFRGASKRRARNLGIPGPVLSDRPGMTETNGTGDL